MIVNITGVMLGRPSTCHNHQPVLANRYDCLDLLFLMFIQKWSNHK